MQFRILKLKCGGFIPQVLDLETWKGIDKTSFFNVFFGMRKYETWCGFNDICKLSSEQKAEEIINGYAEWVKKNKFRVVKDITIP